MADIDERVRGSIQRAILFEELTAQRDELLQLVPLARLGLARLRAQITDDDDAAEVARLAVLLGKAEKGGTR